MNHISQKFWKGSGHIEFYNRYLVGREFIKKIRYFYNFVNGHKDKVCSRHVVENKFIDHRKMDLE